MFGIYQLILFIISNTVFHRIHAPARTPKNPEGCVYSGIIKSKSINVGRLRGIPELTVSFLMRADRAFMHTQLKNKMAICDFGPVTVKSCKRGLFFIYIWIILWDATNKSLIQR